MENTEKIDISKLSKKERESEAKKYWNSINDGEYRLHEAITALAADFDLDVCESERIILECEKWQKI